jgi:hypothetical protein
MEKMHPVHVGPRAVTPIDYDTSAATRNFPRDLHAALGQKRIRDKISAERFCDAMQQDIGMLDQVAGGAVRNQMGFDAVICEVRSERVIAAIHSPSGDEVTGNK